MKTVFLAISYKQEQIILATYCGTSLTGGPCMSLSEFSFDFNLYLWVNPYAEGVW